MSVSNTAVLSIFFPGVSQGLLTGRVPTDSMSQLEKVRRPKRVDFAVIRIHFRLLNGTDVIVMSASCMESVRLLVAAWLDMQKCPSVYRERTVRELAGGGGGQDG